MFKSKYIFETKHTRFIRYVKSTLSVLAVLSFTYLISGYLFLQVAVMEKSRSLEKFYGITPDLVVIFTGAPGRIPYGISIAKKYKQSNIFITGVHDQNNLQTIITPLTINEEIDTQLIEIDYFARNTVENVLSTRRYIRGNKGLKNVLIVSHDYHIPRIKTVVSHTRRSDEQFNFYYMGVESSFPTIASYKVLYKEVYKYLRTYLFLKIWTG